MGHGAHEGLEGAITQSTVVVKQLGLLLSRRGLNRGLRLIASRLVGRSPVHTISVLGSEFSVGVLPHLVGE